MLLAVLLVLNACQLDPSPTQSTPPATPDIDATKRPSSTPHSQKAEASPSPTQPTSELGVEAEDLKDVVVSFWHPWEGSAEVLISKLAADFNRTNTWSIKVQAASQEGFDGLDENMRAALERNDPPGLVTTYVYQALGWMQGTSSGLLIKLEPYLTDPIWGFDVGEIEDFPPAFWQSDVVEGRRLGLPAGRSAQLLYYNVTWAKELGFESPPATPEQFKSQACAAARANTQDDNPDNDTTGGWIISTRYSTLLGWMEAFGGEILTATDQGYQFNTSSVNQAFTYLRGLFDTGCAWLAEEQSSEEQFAARRGLFAAGSLTGIPLQVKAFELAGNQDQWTVIPFPSPRGQPAIAAYGPSFVVLRSTPAQQLAAWLFVKWLTTPENQVQLALATGYFPVRNSSMELLAEAAADQPQWIAALDLVGYARPEPNLRSWNSVRWAVSDAGIQLFRYYFSSDQVPALTRLLQQTAADLRSTK